MQKSLVKELIDAHAQYNKLNDEFERIADFIVKIIMDQYKVVKPEAYVFKGSYDISIRTIEIEYDINKYIKFPASLIKIDDRALLHFETIAAINNGKVKIKL